MEKILKRLKEEIDLSPIVNKSLDRYEAELTEAYLRMKGIYDFNADKIAVKYEEVTNYSIKVLTIRYDGDIVLRRYQMDMTGLKYRFESPIFNNLRQ